MSGHVAKRRRRWPWAILSFLFALAFASSFAVMEERVDDVWSILRIGSAVGLGISLLLLVRAFISSRRHRRAQKDDGRRAEGDEEEPPTEQRAPTYEEVFGLEPDLDAGGLPRAPGDEGWPGDDEHAPTSDEDVQALHADLDEAVDQVEALDADGDSQEHLRRIREQIKARAEEAALRVKQREAELHEAASASDPER
jgi:flagellar biosynthesis/type III secretory pathway M-ring protein FliF/YscJ